MTHTLRFVIIASLLVFPVHAARAQHTQVITLSIDARVAEDVAPFDVPFMARAEVAEEVVRVSPVVIVDGRREQVPASWLTTGEQKTLYLKFTPIAANKQYALDLTVTRRLSEAEVAAKRNDVEELVDRALVEADFEKPGFVSRLGDASKQTLFAEWDQLIGRQDGVDVYLESGDGPRYIKSEAALASLANDVALSNAEIARREHREQIIAYREEASERLEALRGHEQLDAVARWIGGRSGKVAQDRDRQRAVEELVRLPAAVEQSIVEGTSSLGDVTHTVGRPGADLDSVREPEALAPMIASYNQTYVALDWVGVLVYQASGAGAVGGTAELRRALDETAGLFEALTAEVIGLQRALAARRERVDAVAGEFSRTLEEHARIDFTTTPEFETRASSYYGADFGLAVAPELDGVYPYVGVNFYFRPVNKDAPVGFGRGWGEFTRRFALTLGVALTSVEKENERRGLIGNNALLAGAGYRLTPSLRGSAGAVLYKSVDSNGGDELRARYYLALSFDWDIKGAFGGLGDKLW